MSICLSASIVVAPRCRVIAFQDYVLGVQNGSIAGTEGITFHAGDGSHDTDMDITSTLANLNLQLGRLPLGPKREPRGHPLGPRLLTLKEK